MAVLKWLALGAVGLFLHSKSNEKSTKRINLSPASLDVEQAEFDRSFAVNETRRKMPCLFIGTPTRAIFESLAIDAAKGIERIKNIIVKGAIVYCTVESLTGLSNWEFSVDFNNWGHINGCFWVCSENYDSSIPSQYGKTLSGLIYDYLHERGIVVKDFSDCVDANKSLGTDFGLDTHYRERRLRKLLRNKARCISMSYDSEYYSGEHIYPVISILKQEGFVNIKSIPIEDVDDNNSHYIYEVDSISIAGTAEFKYGYVFPHNAEVTIYYHSKRRIVMPCSVHSFRRKNYIAVGDYLNDLGFTKIYEMQIKNLVVGLVSKDGSVESVYVDDGEKVPIVRGESYYYDTKFVITYHTYKR